MRPDVASSAASVGSYGAPVHTWGDTSLSSFSPFAACELIDPAPPTTLIQSLRAPNDDVPSQVPVHPYSYPNHLFSVAVEPSREKPLDTYKPSLISSDNAYANTHAIFAGYSDNTSLAPCANPLQGHQDQRNLPYAPPFVSESPLPNSSTDTVTPLSFNEAGPSVTCLMDGCRKPIVGRLSTGAVSKHLRDDHALLMSGKHARQCQWPGCQKTLMRDSIAKHVANSHFHAARRKCLRCSKLYSTRDAFVRHKSSCAAQSSPAIPVGHRYQRNFGRTTGL